MKKKTDKNLAIARFFLMVKSEKEMQKLLDELLTDSERGKIYERIKIIDSLLQGYSQRETVQKTGAAIATVGRGVNLIKRQKLLMSALLKKAKTNAWWRNLFWCT
jgi:Trp operon repressor